jgi:hypothetical protein
VKNEQTNSLNELQADILQEIEGLIKECIDKKLEKLRNEASVRDG